jgi:acyl carrier protein
MAAKLKASEGKRWSATGIGWIAPVRGLETLEQLILDDYTQVSVLPIDWTKFLSRIPEGSEPSWVTDIARKVREAAPQAGGGPPALLEKLNNVTATERHEVLLTYMRQQAARVLVLEDTDLPDARRPLNELGFDSLTGVEFCNRISQAIGQQLNPALLFDYPTLESLAGHLVRDVLGLESELAEEPPVADDKNGAANARERILNDVEGMSEEEMEALVMGQLERLQQ